MFGVSGASFAAILAAAGFAVGLALQGTLSHFAAGETLEALVRETNVGVVAHLNASARSTGGGSRAGAIARLRCVLRDAQEYDARRQDFLTGQMQPLSAGQCDLEALLPVLRGEVPVLVTANRRSDIEATLRLANEFDLRVVLLRGREAWQVAGRLAAQGIGVIVDPLDNVPTYDAPSARLDNAAPLAAAGVPAAFATFDAYNARNIRQLAGNAVANGMDWDDVLADVTRVPSNLFGLESTLAPGHHANVVVWSGDPFELSAAAEHVFIHGREMPEMTRQRALMERYRARIQ